LRQYEECCGVVVNWLIFGSSGHKTAPAGLVIENFTNRAPLDLHHNRHVKTIVNTVFASRCVGNPHAFIYCDGLLPVNEAKESVPSTKENAYGAKTAPSVQFLRINHYVVKSREECEQKCLRGGQWLKISGRKVFYYFGSQ